MLRYFQLRRYLRNSESLVIGHTHRDSNQKILRKDSTARIVVPSLAWVNQSGRGN